MRKPASENGVIKTLIGFLLTMLAFIIAYVAPWYSSCSIRNTERKKTMIFLDYFDYLN